MELISFHRLIPYIKLTSIVGLSGYLGEMSYYILTIASSFLEDKRITAAHIAL